MKIEYLLDLFELGQYKQCLWHLSDFLYHNNNHPNALLLRGKCLFEVSNARYNRFEEAYEDFIKVLEFDPNNEEALQRTTYIAVFGIKQNIENAIALCSRWLHFAGPKDQIKALTYRAEAYRLSKNYTLALKDYDKLISIAKLVYAEDRVKLDAALSTAYSSKTQLYLHDMSEEALALETFKLSLRYPSPNALLYAEMAKLAFKFQDYEFGGAIALRFFSVNTDIPAQEVRQLYQQLTALVEQQIINQNIVQAKLVAATAFREIVEVNPLDNLNFIRKCMAIYPDWHVPYHYYGAELFEAEGYQEAIPYIKKSLELGGTAFDISRYLEAIYRTKNHKTEIDKLPIDDAIAYYNAAKSFLNAELKLKNQDNSQWFLENRTLLYAQSFQAFQLYFIQHLGISYHNDVEIFAKCCNEYAIALANLNRFEEADKVHDIGNSFHVFWQQLSSWSETLMNLRRYEEVICKVQQALLLGKEDISFDHYIQLRCREALALYHVNRIEEAKNIFDTIEQEYCQFFNSSSTTDEEKRVLTERYVDLQNVRFYLLEKETAEYVIAVWQDQLEKNPDDRSSWLMLMQKYYEVDDYEQCIACANNYLALNGGAVSAEIALHVYFRRGVALVNMQNYERALSDLNFVFELHNKKMPLANSDFLSLCKNLAYSYKQLGNWRSCLGYTQLALDIMAVNEGKFDEFLPTILILYADAQYALGNRRKAHRALNKILSQQENDTQALERKQAWKKAGWLSFFNSK